VTDAGGPKDIKFLWKFRGDSLSRDTLNQAIQTRCCLSVYRWDRSLGGGFSWAGMDTVRSTVGISPSASISWPQDFHLEATYPWSGVPSTSKPEKIWRGPVQSYFEAEIYPIFRSERCSTCHKMGDGQAISDQHNAGDAFKGYPKGLFPYSAASLKPDLSDPCTDCHIAEWKSPAFAKGINWKEKKDAREICQTVNLRLSAKEQKHAHFHDDTRIKWAVSDGSVMGHDHPVAPPGNFASFLAIIDRWIEAGSPCPL
jgi:hypothetical protein